LVQQQVDGILFILFDFFSIDQHTLLRMFNPYQEQKLIDLPKKDPEIEDFVF
jgi:hypothetical protein